VEIGKGEDRDSYAGIGQQVIPALFITAKEEIIRR
jgi:hypothetical protein